MLRAATAAALAAFLFSTGCFQAPVPVVEFAQLTEVAPGEQRPVLYVGSTGQRGPVERRRVLDDTEARLHAAIPHRLAPILPVGSDPGVEATFTDVQSRGLYHYAAALPKLPPHWLVKYHVEFDATGLPSLREQVNATRGNPVAKLAFSWLPRHRIRVGLECRGSLFLVDGLETKHMGDVAFESALDHWGTLWWRTHSWAETARTSYDHLASACLDELRELGAKKVARDGPWQRFMPDPSLWFP